MGTPVRFRSPNGLDGASQTLTNVAAGVNGTDATNLTQVNAAISTAIAGITGGLNYRGTWNASTNTPSLASGTGTQGYFYKVSVAGTTNLDGNANWSVGDLALYDGAQWQKIDGVASEITSVAGRTGAVTLSQSDISGLTTTDSPTFSAVTATTFTGNLTGNVTGNVSGTAANVTGTVAIANGGTGATTAAAALTALGAYPAANPNGYVNAAAAASAAPVQSVAGRTGVITLNQADIGGLTTSSSPTFAAVTVGAVNTANAASFSGTVTSSATTAGQTVDTFNTSTFRTAKYTISVSSGSSAQAIELLALFNGTDVELVPYGTTNTQLATFDASYSSGVVTLTYTPANAVTKVVFDRTAISA